MAWFMSPKIRTVVTLVSLAVFLALISFWVGQQSYNWFPPQASAESQLVDRLFSFLVTIGTFIFLGVSGTLGYAVLFQRAGKYETGDGPDIEGNLTLELIWTAIPLALVIWIAAYSFQIYTQMGILGPMEHVHAGTGSGEMAMASNLTNRIEVRARQWAWEFYYPNQNITSSELHLPANQRAALTLVSEDVLHGFFVPAFRIKQDLIPGRTIDFAFTPILEGTYRLRDSQYSGTYFATMQSNVVVESPKAYQEWLATTAAQPPVLAENPAYSEYQQLPDTAWKRVVPASPRLVNDPVNTPANDLTNVPLKLSANLSTNLAAGHGR